MKAAVASKKSKYKVPAARGVQQDASGADTQERVGREKGKNWSVEECVKVTRSFLAIGKDPIVGNGQSGGTFYERIWMDFNKALEDDAAPRKLRSVETKWHEINKDCGKFAEKFAQVQDLKISGISEEDEIQKAPVAYKSEMGKAFKHMECWRILRHEPKWHDLREDKEKEKKSSDPATRGSPVPGDVNERGVGVKAAKAAANAVATAAQGQKQLILATLQLAATTKKRVRALEEANHIALFATTLGNLDEDAQDFFKLRRADILHRLRTKDKQPQAQERRDDAAPVTCRVVVGIEDDEAEEVSPGPTMSIDVNDDSCVDVGDDDGSKN